MPSLTCALFLRETPPLLSAATPPGPGGIPSLVPRSTSLSLPGGYYDRHQPSCLSVGIHVCTRAMHLCVEGRGHCPALFPVGLHLTLLRCALSLDPELTAWAGLAGHNPQGSASRQLEVSIVTPGARVSAGALDSGPWACAAVAWLSPDRHLKNVIFGL